MVPASSTTSDLSASNKIKEQFDSIQKQYPTVMQILFTNTNLLLA
jgi:hypothetical protein